MFQLLLLRSFALLLFTVYAFGTSNAQIVPPSAEIDISTDNDSAVDNDDNDGSNNPSAPLSAIGVGELNPNGGGSGAAESGPQTNQKVLSAQIVPPSDGDIDISTESDDSTDNDNDSPNDNDNDNSNNLSAPSSAIAVGEANPNGIGGDQAESGPQTDQKVLSAQIVPPSDGDIDISTESDDSTDNDNDSPNDNDNDGSNNSSSLLSAIAVNEPNPNGVPPTDQKHKCWCCNGKFNWCCSLGACHGKK